MSRQKSLYEKLFKRPIDIICALLAMTVFCWLYALVALLVRIKLGSPVIFKQYRPGMIDPKTGREKIFKMYKFRTMTDERDETGRLLPDEIRLTKFGKLLRSLSLDELPEAVNILKGDMSVIGPRPQLVRDMVFMTPRQRCRHLVRPGLSGLAQISGRNAVTWEGKIETDLKYIEKITFINDLMIVVKTVIKAVKREGIAADGMETAEDLGDYLLRRGEIDKETYEKGQNEAKQLIGA